MSSAVVTRAVIPAAGFGTRMLPFTKAVPKELIPLVDKPVIQYVVEEAERSGITDILIILSDGKEAVKNHFSPADELEKRLAETGKKHELEALRAIGSKVNISYVCQQELNGLGGALLLAEEFTGREPFAVLLGDTVLEEEPGCTPVTAQLISHFAGHRCSVAAAEKVPQEKLSRYGIMGGKKISDRAWKITAMEEKPSPDQAPGKLAVASRYIFTPEIFPALHRTLPGKNNEIQLTDAMCKLIPDGKLDALEIQGTRYDLGSKSGFVIANLLFGIRRDELAQDIMEKLETLFLRK